MAFILVCALLAFAPVLGNELVSWDDDPWLVQNPAFNPPNLHGLTSIWTTPFQHLYVPVPLTAWFGIALAAGHSPGAFHAASLAVHLVNVALCHRLLKGLGLYPVLGAIAFAVHPVMAEGVAWASGLKDLLCTTCMLGSMLALVGESGRKLRWGALGWLLPALLCKPTAMVLPAMWAAVWAWGLGRPMRGLAGTLLAAAPLVVGFGALAAMAQTGEAVKNTAPPAMRPLVTLDAYGFYLRKLAAPVGLTIDYARKPSWVAAEGRWVPHAVAAVVALGVVLALRRRLIWLAAALFVLPILPVSGLKNFDFAAASVTADHYAYPAMIGVAVLLGGVRLPGRGRMAVAGGLAVVLGAMSFSQARTWRDNLTLYTHAVAVSPRSAAAHSNLGSLFLARRDYVAALREFDAALENDPTLPAALGMAAECQLELGDPKAASLLLRRSQEALKDNPKYWDLVDRVKKALGKQ